MSKPTLVFVDHSYHKRTSSTYFLRDILCKDFDITNLWSEEWRGGKMPSTNDLNAFDYVLFFQVLPDLNELRNIKARIAWVPMYDAVIWWPQTKWILLASINMKIISFSDTITDILTKNGFDVIGLRAYLNPSKLPICKFDDGLNIFYWQRTNIDFERILNCLPKNNVNRLIIKIDPDPGYKPYVPSTEIKNRYNLTIIKGDVGKNKYLEHLKTCNVYVAPRKIEGIGWSFIEAMSMGMVVIANNLPTMSEYISNEYNGILVDKYKHLKIYDYDQMVNMAKMARQSCKRGFDIWQLKSNNIAKFIRSSLKVNNSIDLLENNLFFMIKHLFFSSFASFKFNRFRKN